MEEYHKIDSLFKRDHETNQFIPEITTDDFKALWNCDWVGTEQLDGTNIRIGLMQDYSHGDIPHVEVRGKTDKAQIPPHLFRKLQEIFTLEKVESIINFDENGTFPDFCLYGEGIGKKIQKGGGNYIPDDTGFVLFDVNIDGWWLKRDDVDEIACKLGVQSVPVRYCGDLIGAIRMVAKGFGSEIAKVPGTQAEGLVLTPKTGLLSRNHRRIITKVKTKDFRKIKDLDGFLLEVTKEIEGEK